MQALVSSMFPLKDDKELSPNLEFQIGAMFGILFVSLTAISFPSVSKIIPGLKIPHTVFFIGKHFGTGVIISTAFCHLLQDAFESLADPSVKKQHPHIGSQTGLIILSSLLFIFLVEYISISYVDYLHANPSALPSPAISRSPSPSRSPFARSPIPIFAPPSEEPTISGQFLSPHLRSQTTPSTATTSRATERTPLINGGLRLHSIPIRAYPHQMNQTLHNLMSLTSSRLARGGRASFETIEGVRHRPAGRTGSNEAELERHLQSYVCTIEDDSQENLRPRIGHRRQVVGVLVLQFGIMIHSLVIGLTLAITSGAEFTSLVSAIVFHQLFEGLSLGMRIAALAPVQSRASASRPHTHPSSWTPNWLGPTLCILFAVTTPVGMAIGLLAFTPRGHTGNNHEMAQMYLTQGLMSAMSAGMLIYAATVEMIAGDFVFGSIGGGHGHFHDLPGQDVEEENQSGMGEKLLAVASLLAGVAGMGLLGLVE